MREYKPRIVDEILKDKLEAKGAVVIEGPKWCGKTTTAMQIARSVLRMDEPSKRETNIQMSEIAPERLLKGDTPRLIDEWQIAPKLWDATRYEVDWTMRDGMVRRYLTVRGSTVMDGGLKALQGLELGDKGK